MPFKFCRRRRRNLLRTVWALKNCTNSGDSYIASSSIERPVDILGVGKVHYISGLRRLKNSLRCYSKTSREGDFSKLFQCKNVTSNIIGVKFSYYSPFFIFLNLQLFSVKLVWDVEESLYFTCIFRSSYYPAKFDFRNS